eukprot:CAMPEP_0181389238 /NCGR_PEP_ID=MMETSP1106-20121128/24792_1 /TAXON_ID=81844 /ORGANISM="Mantoniella antarctica, Strain SL-175" /LENGTH=47 /DNA_ID= /DNA_START= /DNA_END= /DNA_ORIENTATION=
MGAAQRPRRSLLAVGIVALSLGVVTLFRGTQHVDSYLDAEISATSWQ